MVRPVRRRACSDGSTRGRLEGPGWPWAGGPRPLRPGASSCSSFRLANFRVSSKPFRLVVLVRRRQSPPPHCGRSRPFVETGFIRRSSCQKGSSIAVMMPIMMANSFGEIHEFLGHIMRSAPDFTPHFIDPSPWGRRSVRILIHAIQPNRGFTSPTWGAAGSPYNDILATCCSLHCWGAVRALRSRSPRHSQGLKRLTRITLM